MPARFSLTSIDEVFGIWSTQPEMARAVGVPWQRLAKWSQRKRIPPEAFDAVIAAAARKGRRLTLVQLNKLNKPRATVRQVSAAEGMSHA